MPVRLSGRILLHVGRRRQRLKVLESKVMVGKELFLETEKLGNILPSNVFIDQFLLL